MAKPKSEVSILVTAKDEASKIVIDAVGKLNASAKDAAAVSGAWNAKVVELEKALRKMGLTEEQIASSVTRAARAFADESAAAIASAAATGKHGDESAKAAAKAKDFSAAMTGDAAAATRLKASFDTGTRSVAGLTAGLSGDTAAFNAWRTSVKSADTAIHSVAAGMASVNSVEAKFALAARQNALERAKSAADAAKQAAANVTLKDSFKNLAQEIPFLNRGLDIFKAFLTTGPGLAAGFALGIGLITVKALEMADKVQQALLVLRNQIPGVGKDLTELRAVIKEVSQLDPTGRSQIEIANVGRVIAKNGVESLDAFRAHLLLVIQAANATGESTDGLAEGLDLLADAFNLKGDALAGTFAKIVVAANGLVPIPDLFQALGRGSTTLQTFGVDAETAAKAVTSFANAGIPGREAGQALVRVLDQVRDIGRPVTDELQAASRAGKALGIDFSQAHIKAIGLPAFLRELQTRSAGSADALDAMGFTAKEATAIIRGDFSPSLITAAEAEKTLEEQSRGAGESIGAMSARLHRDLDDVLISLGTKLLPPVVNLLRDLDEILDQLSSGNNIAGQGKLGLLQTLLGGLIGNKDLVAEGARNMGEAWGKGFKQGADKELNNWDKLANLGVAPKDRPIKEGGQITAKNSPLGRTPTKSTLDAEEAGRRARAAADQKKHDDAAKKALEDELNLLTVKTQLGKDTEKDRARLLELEKSIVGQLDNQHISVEKRLGLEASLSKIKDIQQAKLTIELDALEARQAAGKATNDDATRLTQLYDETAKKLQDQNLSLVEQTKLYALLNRLAADLAKTTATIGKNLGAVIDQTRQGATPKEEQAARDAANKPASEGGGGFISGIGGEAGSSQFTDDKAKATTEAIANAKKRTEEFTSGLRNAIAGPVADFFQAFAKGFDNIGEAAKSALQAVADAVINLVSQHIGDKLARSLFPEEKDKVLGPTQGVGAQPEIGTITGTAQDTTIATDKSAVVATTAEVTATQVVVQGPVVPGSDNGIPGAGALVEGDQTLPDDVIHTAGKKLEEAGNDVKEGAAVVKQGGLSLGDAAGLIGAAALALGGLKKGKVGGLLGGIAGFIVGGPAGASLGAGIGSQLGFADGGVVKKTKKIVHEVRAYKDGGLVKTKGFFEGVPAYANGTGFVRGPGGPRSDSIHAMVSRGEGILTAKTVQHIGGESTVNYLNQLSNPVQLQLPRFADGGVVGAAREGGKSEVTLMLPPGVSGSTTSEDATLKVLFKHRRTIRDMARED